MFKVWSPEDGFREDDNGDNKSNDGVNVNAVQQFYRQICIKNLVDFTKLANGIALGVKP